MEWANTSVWARRRDPRIRVWFEQAVVSYEIAVCDMVALEQLVAASASAYETAALGMESLPWIGNDSRGLAARQVRPAGIG